MSAALLALDPAALALAAGVAFAAGVLAGVSGFGVGLVLPAFLVPLVGIEGVIPTMAVAMLITNGSRLVAYRGAVRLDALRVLLPVTLPAAGASAFVYTMLDARAIALVLGLLLIAMVPLRRALAARRFVPGPRTWAAVGLGYGALAGVATGSGAILIAGLMAAGLGGAALVATDAAVATLVNLLRLAVYGGDGLLLAARVAAGLVIGAATIPAAFVARALIDRLSGRLHAGIMETLVIGGGLSFLWRAFA